MEIDGQRTALGRRGPWVLAALVVVLSAGSADAADEVLEYHWRLMGFRGALVRIFFPGSGDGRLSTGTNEAGNVETELLISSRKGRKGEFWLYGSEVEPGDRRTLRAWQEQHFRGRSKSKESVIDNVEALDLASSILFLRRERPEKLVVKMIWASGELRPVAVRPVGRGSAVLGGRTVTTHRYELRGAGEPFWDGELDIELADDDAATPVEIIVTRDGWRVRLRLVGADS